MTRPDLLFILRSCPALRTWCIKKILTSSFVYIGSYRLKIKVKFESFVQIFGSFLEIIAGYRMQLIALSIRYLLIFCVRVKQRDIVKDLSRSLLCPLVTFLYYIGLGLYICAYEMSGSDIQTCSNQYRKLKKIPHVIYGRPLVEKAELLYCELQ